MRLRISIAIQRGDAASVLETRPVDDDAEECFDACMQIMLLFFLLLFAIIFI